MGKILVPRIKRMGKKVAPRIEKEQQDLMMIGPGDYRNVGVGILSRGLQIPTGREVSYHLRESYASNDKDIANSTEAEILREVLDNTFLWVFNRHTWTPKEYKNAGVYVVHDPKAVGSSEYEELEDLLSGSTSERGVRFSKNRLVRFAPYGTFREIRRHKDLTQHGMVIAGYDIDGAENLVEVSKALKKMPRILICNNDSDYFVDAVASLDSSEDFHSGGLCVDGNNRDGSYGYGFAFGVLPKSAEGTASKK